jgi:hypothetical protein
LLNAALAAAIFWKVDKPLPPGRPIPVEPPVQGDALPVRASELPMAPDVPWQWSQVASDDFGVYRDHLRALGCPELTVQEIIRAAINEHFAADRRRILAAYQEHYWEMVLNAPPVRRQELSQTEWGRALTSLADERQQLMAEVLGPEALATTAQRQAARAEWERKYAWLGPEKCARLVELEEKYQQQVTAWAASLRERANGATTPEDEEKRQQLQQEFDESEQQVLTPEELAELKLRESDVADWAASLPGFKPTEDEWKSLTDLRSQLEEFQQAPENPGLTDEQRLAQQNQWQSNFVNTVAETLGPDRFAQYQLANNDQYQALRSVTQRYGLPDAVAAQSLDIQQSAQAAVQQVQATPNLSPEDQQAELNSIQQETEQTLGQILGANVLATYKEYGGDWIQELNQSRQP